MWNPIRAVRERARRTRELENIVRRQDELDARPINCISCGKRIDGGIGIVDDLIKPLVRSGSFKRLREPRYYCNDVCASKYHHYNEPIKPSPEEPEPETYDRCERCEPKCDAATPPPDEESTDITLLPDFPEKKSNIVISTEEPEKKREICHQCGGKPTPLGVICDKCKGCGLEPPPKEPAFGELSLCKIQEQLAKEEPENVKSYPEALADLNQSYRSPPKEPEKEGNWIKKEDGWYCLKCDTNIGWPPSFASFKCPNCGVSMKNPPAEEIKGGMSCDYCGSEMLQETKEMIVYTCPKCEEPEKGGVYHLICPECGWTCPEDHGGTLKECPSCGDSMEVK